MGIEAQAKTTGESMNRLLIWMIDAYRVALSPVVHALGGGCRFHPTCSAYAREALETHYWSRALQLIAARLVKCGPWNAGGVDPVPTVSTPTK